MLGRKSSLLWISARKFRRIWFTKQCRAGSKRCWGIQQREPRVGCGSRVCGLTPSNTARSGQPACCHAMQYWFAVAGRPRCTSFRIPRARCIGMRMPRSTCPVTRLKTCISRARVAGFGASRRRLRMAPRLGPMRSSRLVAKRDRRPMRFQTTAQARASRKRNCPRIVTLARPKRLSISRTMSPPRTCASLYARACDPSSTSSATPPMVWQPIRASSAT